MDPIFSSTVYIFDGGATSWEVIYNRLEDEHPNIIVTRATTNSTRPSGLQFKDVVYSFLHRIGARAEILPYTNMIRWVVENLTIEDRQFRNSRNKLIGSFRAEDMKKMYHIPNPHDIYDKTYMDIFAKKNLDPFKLIQGWRVLNNKFKFDKLGMYVIASLENPYNYATAMLCRIYGFLSCP